MKFCILIYNDDGTKHVMQDDCGNDIVFDVASNAGKFIATLKAVHEASGTTMHMMKVKPYDEEGAAKAAEERRIAERKARLFEMRKVVGIRFAEGTYKDVPWADEAWFVEARDKNPALIDHWVHVSTDDAAKVAYYRSEEALLEDKATRTTVHKYLTTHFDVPPATAEYWTSHMLPNMEQVQWAHTADEIEHVYTHGPSSCMSHSTSEYKSRSHPTRVYGAGDLAVAYLLHPDRSNCITARVLCYPAKNVYGRIYGNMEPLKTLLEARGMSRAAHGDMAGAKLLRIEQGNGFVMPYLDDSYMVSDTEDGKAFYMCESGDWNAQETCGMIGDDDSVQCAWCNAYVAADDITSVQSDDVCNSCYEDEAMYCEDCEESYHVDSITSVAGGNRSVCTGCDQANYTECESCDERQPNDDIAGETARGNAVCTECADTYAWSDAEQVFIPNDEAHACAECKDNYQEDSIAGENADAEEICKDCAEHYEKASDGLFYMPGDNPDNIADDEADEGSIPTPRPARAVADALIKRLPTGVGDPMQTNIAFGDRRGACASPGCIAEREICSSRCGVHMSTPPMVLCTAPGCVLNRVPGSMECGTH